MYDKFAKVISNLVIIQSKTNWNEITEHDHLLGFLDIYYRRYQDYF